MHRTASSRFTVIISAPTPASGPLTNAEYRRVMVLTRRLNGAFILLSGPHGPGCVLMVSSLNVELTPESSVPPSWPPCGGTWSGDAFI